MIQGKLVLISAFISIIFLDVALSHEPGRDYGGGQHHQGGRGRHGSQEGSHSGRGEGPPGGGGNPGGRHRDPGPPGPPPRGSSGGQQGGSRESASDQGPVIPRCLLEKKSAVLTEFAVLGSRNNFTSFVPHCAQDNSFSSHQEWPALGLSWLVNGEGRMVDKSLTKGRPKCPLKKDFREMLVCLREPKELQCQRRTTLSINKIELSCRPARGDKCRQHSASNGGRYTTPVRNQCNVTMVMNKIRSHCQGRRNCLINPNERLLGRECARKVKYILVNFTCDREETRNFQRWRRAAICLNTDGDDGTFNPEDSGYEFSARRSGVGSDDVDGNDDYGDNDDDDDGDDDDNIENVDDNDDGDNDDDDFSDDDGFLGETDENDFDTFEDNIAHFRRMGFLVACGLPGRMGSGRNHHWRPGPSHHDHHRHHHHHHQHHYRPHCRRINWIRQPDLYKEFNFNPPSVCPPYQPMQSNCDPRLCHLVKCEGGEEVSCRINPCGTCRPECYNANGNEARPPRALTKCEYKRRLEMKYLWFDDITLVPKCNEDGSFAEIQCFPDAEVCWCVDEHGQERKGTRQRGKPTSCNYTGAVLSSCQSAQLNIRSLKKHLRRMAAIYNETASDLKCKAKNLTQRMQYHPVVVPQNQSGQQRNVATYLMSRAKVCRILLGQTRWMERYFKEPKCGADGNFERMQCGPWPSGKKCWCVDKEGKRIGSRADPDRLNCSKTYGGRQCNCPPVMAHDAAQSGAKACQSDNDCSDSKVCCKTRHGKKHCVDPPPKMPPVKPGRCPVVPLSVNFNCTSNCKSDVDCMGNMKCCELGCGKKCMRANMPVCPKDKPFKLCIYDKCLSSPGCPSHPLARCRMNYCGECSAEYFDENDRIIDCNSATKCQRQRHAAIETYKRKFFQAFNTTPVHLPRARHNQSRGERQGGQQRGRQNGWRRPSGGSERNRNGEGQDGMLRGSQNAWLRGGHGAQDGGHRRNRGGDSGTHQGGQFSGMRMRGAGSHGGGGSHRGAGASGMQQGGQGRHNGGNWGGIAGRGGGSRAERHQGDQGGGNGGHQGSGHGRDGEEMGARSGGGHGTGDGHGRAGPWQRGNTEGDRFRQQGQNRGHRGQQPDLGVFIPECNPQNGAFLAEQCNATSGVCWCVDTNGEEKPDTRALMNQERRNCSKFDNKSNVAGDELEIERKGHKKRRVARLKITLKGNFDDVEEKKEQFIGHLKEKIVSICNCKKEQIQNVEIWRGSIKVKFDIVEDVESGSLKESVELIRGEVKAKKFVITFEGKEYHADGAFDLTYLHGKKNAAEHTRLSLAEIIAIGSCAFVALLGSAVFIWKCYGRSKKKQPEGWSDMVKEKPPEVQYNMPESKPPTNGVKNPEANP